MTQTMHVGSTVCHAMMSKYVDQLLAVWNIWVITIVIKICITIATNKQKLIVDKLKPHSQPSTIAIIIAM